MFGNLLSNHGVLYKVIRDNKEIAQEMGLPNHEKETAKKYIGFRPLTDIVPGDCLVSIVNEKVYVSDVQTAYYSGKPFQLKVYYQTEAEHNAAQPTGGTIFNIGTASGSVIGSNNVMNINYTDGLQGLKDAANTAASEADKAELQKLVSLLELVVQDAVPVKKGLLSKFSDTIAKHSWLASQVTGILFNWLTTKLP